MEESKHSDSTSVETSESSQLLVREDDMGTDGGKFIYILTSFAAIGGFLFGYDTGVISGAILFLKDEFMLSPVEQEIIISIALVGAILGSSIGGPLADHFGRKPIILVASLLFALGSVILGISTTIVELLIGRLIVGTGIGVAANIVPIYVAEISPAQNRGSLVTINNLAITTGQFISYLVDSAFVNVPEGWRYMLGIAAFPAIIQFIVIFLIGPESPRWLVSVKQIEKSVQVLKTVRSNTCNARGEINEIEKSLKEENGGWKELFSPSIRPALIVGISLQAFQQFCGINTAMYYSPTILKMAGYTNNATAIWFSDAIAFSNALFTILALYLIDRIGRRRLLMGEVEIF